MNQNNNTLLGIIFGIIVLAGVGFIAFATQNTPATETQDVVDKVQQISEEMPATEETSETLPTEPSTTSQDIPTSNQESTPTASVGSYEAYSADKIARAADGTVVVFFHASWCPSCRALNSNIESNRSEISAGVSILKTDYDSETELRQKYGVTTQHTLVQVDKDGNLIKKWSGGSTLDSIISQIN
jgi:thioredoxin 1